MRAGTELPHSGTFEKSRKPHRRKRQIHQSLNSSLPACVLSPSAIAFHPPALLSKARRFTHWWLQEGWGELKQPGSHHQQVPSSLHEASSQGRCCTGVLGSTHTLEQQPSHLLQLARLGCDLQLPKASPAPSWLSAPTHTTP